MKKIMVLSKKTGEKQVMPAKIFDSLPREQQDEFVINGIDYGAELQPLPKDEAVVKADLGQFDESEVIESPKKKAKK